MSTPDGKKALKDLITGVANACTPSNNGDQCEQPNAVYDLIDEKWNVIGKILYKDIPLGAISSTYAKTPGSCGSVFVDVMHVKGGALNDLMKFPRGK